MSLAAPVEQRHETCKGHLPVPDRGVNDDLEIPDRDLRSNVQEGSSRCRYPDATASCSVHRGQRQAVERQLRGSFPCGRQRDFDTAVVAAVEPPPCPRTTVTDRSAFSGPKTGSDDRLAPPIVDGPEPVDAGEDTFPPLALDQAVDRRLVETQSRRLIEREQTDLSPRDGMCLLQSVMHALDVRETVPNPR